MMPMVKKLEDENAFIERGESKAERRDEGKAGCCVAHLDKLLELTPREISSSNLVVNPLACPS